VKPLTVYFLRHGQSVASRDGLYSGAATDAELTPTGEAMALAFAAAYRHHSWTEIVASTQRRALRTAQPLAAAVGLTVKSDPRWSEIAYGKWEGKSAEQVQASYRDDHLRWSADPALNPPTGGETAIALARRALAALDGIRERVPSGNVLVVSHKGTIRATLCGLLGVDIGRFRQRFACPVASLSVVEFGVVGPQLLALADRSHLDRALREAPGT
jgi:broad specificity phosphatase PhoE